MNSIQKTSLTPPQNKSTNESSIPPPPPVADSNPSKPETYSKEDKPKRKINDAQRDALEKGRVDRLAKLKQDRVEKTILQFQQHPEVIAALKSQLNSEMEDQDEHDDGSRSGSPPPRVRQLCDKSTTKGSVQVSKKLVSAKKKATKGEDGRDKKHPPRSERGSDTTSKKKKAPRVEESEDEQESESEEEEEESSQSEEEESESDKENRPPPKKKRRDKSPPRRKETSRPAQVPPPYTVRSMIRYV
jgi:hypothetical protein